MNRTKVTISINIERLDGDDEYIRIENERLAKALEYGIKSTATIEELAAMCYQSVSTFKRRFRVRYSQPPHKWLTEQRLALTREAILTTSLPLGDIVEASGFINSSHFISLFRRHYGITPARLRRQYRQRHNEQSNHKAVQL